MQHSNLPRERIKVLKETALAALAYSGDERSSFIMQACDGDEGLYDEVMSLLEANTSEAGFLESHIAPQAKTPYQNIGPYKVLAEIGQGGMGQVYLGRRDDGAYHQEVAIKVSKIGFPKQHLAERFREERQILARMNHPHIARLYDGGTTDDHLPYLVMEYVEGVPIHTYCEQNQLSLRARLRLFQKVCTAVRFAHRNLVVHRDLKPGNILVTQDGEPRLLDFGIAKILDAGHTGQSGTATQFLVMTPEYASPEQVRGETVTTSSDIYSLGVILYLLLTGHRPYRLEGMSNLEMQKVVCGQEPLKPSITGEELSDSDDAGDTTGTRRWRQSLRGDLDNIVLMALRKEADRRYASVDALEDDISRYLKGFPVRARGDSASYRAAKFVRRHRFGVGVAATVCLLVLAFTTLLVFQRQATERARVQAEAERDQAERITQYLTDLFDHSDPYHSARGDLRVKEVLMPAIQGMEDMRENPDVRADLMDTLGLIMVKLELFDEARPLLEESLSFRRDTRGEDHEDTLKSFLHMGRYHLGMGHYEQAEKWLVKAQKTTGATRTECEISLADTRFHLGKYTEAADLYQKAISHLKTSTQSDQRTLVWAMQGLAMTHVGLGEREQAETYYQEALKVAEEGLGKDHLAYANVQDELANLYRRMGRLEEAEKSYLDVLETRERHLGPRSNGVAASRNNLGWLYLIAGDYEKSERYLEQALSIRRQILAPDSDYLATSLNNLGGLFLVMGRYSEAEPLYFQALAIRKKILGEEHGLYAATLNNLGYIQVLLGQYNQAEARLNQALAIRESGSSKKHPGIGRTRVLLGMLEYGRGRDQEAAVHFTEACRVFEATLGYMHPDMAAAITGLGDAAKLRQAFSEAEAHYEEAHAIFAGTVGTQHLYAAENRIKMADLRQQQGALDAAEAYLRQALAIIEEKVPYDNPHLAGVYYDLARIFHLRNQPDQARPLGLEALRLQVPLLGEGHCKVQDTRALLGQLESADQSGKPALVRQ